MLLDGFYCGDFCYDGKEIFVPVAFCLNIPVLFVELLLFHSKFCVSQLILGGYMRMNIFLETICQFGHQNLAEVYCGRGQSEKFEY